MGAFTPGMHFLSGTAFSRSSRRSLGPTPTRSSFISRACSSPPRGGCVRGGARSLGRTVPAAAATAATVAIIGMAPGHGGALTALALPATASRQLLVPAVVALALGAIRHPRRVTLASAAAGSLVLALVHPTYAIFVWLPLAGFVAVRYAWTRLDLRPGMGVLGALALPAAAFFALLLPVINDTVSVSPGVAERLRSLKHYAGQLDVRSPDSFSTRPRRRTVERVRLQSRRSCCSRSRPTPRSGDGLPSWWEAHSWSSRSPCFRCYSSRSPMSCRSPRHAGLRASFPTGSRLLVASASWPTGSAGGRFPWPSPWAWRSRFSTPATSVTHCITVGRHW